MKIPSRAWGFVRAGLNNSFGVTVPNFGTGGTHANPLLNDVDAGDEAAGVEFCPVFASQASSGVLSVYSDGALWFVGAADGTYVIPYSLFTFTPGAAASFDEGDTSVTINVGALVYAASLVEAAAAGDSLSALLTSVRQLTESSSAAEGLVAALTAVAALTESSSTSEALTTGPQFAGALTETSSAADAIAALTTLVSSLSEAASAVDASTAVATLVATLAESVSAADAPVASTPGVYTAAVAELASALDALAAAFFVGGAIDPALVRRVVRSGALLRLAREAITRSTKGH